MNRRDFLRTASVSSVLATLPIGAAGANRTPGKRGPKELNADIVIIGGGLGGCAAALAAARNGLRVILTEETDWIGGQLTSQAVPPDEHQWIETHGCTKSYRALRTGIRDYYRAHYPLTDAARARPQLNPGDGSVSRLCHEPRVAVAVLEAMLAPHISSGRVRLMLETRAVDADVSGDRVRSIKVYDQRSGADRVLVSPYFIDATEPGDLLPLTKTEFVLGAESASETGELHAAGKANSANQQAFTICFALTYDPNREHVIETPRDYKFWRNHIPRLTPPWPGRLLDLTYTHPPSLQAKTLGFNPTGATTGTLNLWTYRRIINAKNFVGNDHTGDTSIINWPQNDYMLGNLIGVSERERKRHLEGARQLSLSLAYWLQTEAPRPDGGQGWPGLQLRGDLLGTDGLAKYPYIREARRIRAEFTVLEQHVGLAARARVTGKPEAEVRAEEFPDTVGIGSYPIDLHPTSTGDNYIDFQTRPFQIPLGALLPVRVDNLLPACKNIGTTHVTNGCYRLHPVEWNIGEAVGLLLAFSLRKQLPPRAIRERTELLAEFQNWIRDQGVETHWPRA